MPVLSLRAARQGFIEPCLPSRTAHPPLGPGWLHEIKYDGFRLMAHREGRGVQLLSQRGYDWTNRFRLIAEAVASVRCRSCLIDGEAVALDDQGTPVFKLLVHAAAFSVPMTGREPFQRYWRPDADSWRIVARSLP